MSFIKQSSSQYILYDTGLENIFILEYMSKAPGDWVKAYVLAQMYVQLGQPLSNEALAKALGLSAPQILECWDYWESEGVIRKIFKDQGGEYDYDVEFLALKEQLFGRGPSAKSSQKAAELDDKDLSRLYSGIEEITGRLLEGREPEIVAEWLTVYGMSPDLILAGYRYCVDSGKTNRYSYVGTILKDWKAKGLATAQDVQAYLSDRDRYYDLYRKIFNALGFRRNPGEEEKRRMRSWVEELQYSEDRILEACSKTSGISNPNINYVDSVLRGWYKEEHGNAPSGAKESFFARVMAMYEEDRKNNAQKTAEIRRKIYEELPRVRQINEELNDARYKLSRAIFAGPNGAASVERERAYIDRLTEERKQLLLANGYSADAGETIYTCRKCKDTGELDDGSRCTCFAEKLALVQAEGR